MAGRAAPGRDAVASARRTAETYERACELGELVGCHKAIAFYRTEDLRIVDPMTGAELGREDPDWLPGVRGLRAASLENRVVELRLAAARKANTVTAYRTFLQMHGTSPRAAEATREMATLELAPVAAEARRTRDVSGLLDFGARYPELLLELPALLEVGMNGQPLQRAERAMEYAGPQRTEAAARVGAEVARKIADLRSSAKERVCALRSDAIRSDAPIAGASDRPRDGLLKLIERLQSLKADCAGTSATKDWPEPVGTQLLAFTDSVATRTTLATADEARTLSKLYLTVAEASEGSTAAVVAKEKAARILLDAAKRDDRTATILAYLSDFGRMNEAEARKVFAELIVSRGKDIDGDDCRRFEEAFPRAPEASQVRVKCANVRAREAAEQRRAEAEERARARAERQAAAARRAAGGRWCVFSDRSRQCICGTPPRGLCWTDATNVSLGMGQAAVALLGPCSPCSD